MEQNNEMNNTSMNNAPQSQKPKTGGWKLWLGLVIIVILGLVIININKDKAEVMVVPAGDTSADVIDVTDIEAPTTTGTGAASISYQNALVKYKDARIQLNDQCQATPRTSGYKVGASVMIDNRADVSRSVLFNGTRYTIGALSFKIVKLNAAKTFLVDCDKSQNVATITVQK